MKITILRTDDSCPDVLRCPAVLDIDRHPERRYVIVKETDPELLAACAHLVGDDEVLGWADPGLFSSGS